MHRFAVIFLLLAGCCGQSPPKVCENEEVLHAKYNEAWDQSRHYVIQFEKLARMRHDRESKIRDAENADQAFGLMKEALLLQDQENYYWENYKQAEERKKEIVNLIKELPRK